MTKWEYRGIGRNWGERDANQLIDELNRLGLDGWELVSFDYDGWLCLLKRPLADTAPHHATPTSK